MSLEPCTFCGHPYDLEHLGEYGCPNCLGEGLDDNHKAKHTMKIFYFQISHATEAFMAIPDTSQAQAESRCRRWLKLNQGGFMTRLSRKPARISFTCDTKTRSLDTSGPAPKVKTGAGRPRGSTIPKGTHRRTFTVTVGPDTFKRISKLPRGAVGRFLDEQVDRIGS